MDGDPKFTSLFQQNETFSDGIEKVFNGGRSLPLQRPAMLDCPANRKIGSMMTTMMHQCGGDSGLEIMFPICASYVDGDHHRTFRLLYV